MLDNTKIIEQTGALNHLTKEDLLFLKKYSRQIGTKLCRILRHHPEMIQIEMNKQAWVYVDELIEKFNAYSLNLPILMEIVRTDNKQRYGLKYDNDNHRLMIRCRQGHSIPWLEMDYREEMPPEVLYHGTITTYLDSIMEQGLLPMTRQKVHLSADIATAKSVANRRKSKGEPVILQVDVKKMVDNGIAFYLSDNEVWLVDRVPPKYLSKK
jgi:putative RNA 2'-phosphotransferase